MGGAQCGDRQTGDADRWRRQDRRGGTAADDDTGARSARGDRDPGRGVGCEGVQVGARLCRWLGLTPRQFGSGGKQRSGGISKQGDRTLRTLLTLGATAHLKCERGRGPRDPWLRALLARRPFKVAAVAYAAKMARIIWAMLVSGEPYRAFGQRRKAVVQAAA